MNKYKYTMEELRKAYNERAESDKKSANSPLWVIASSETIKILNENNRREAVKKLRKLRKEYRNMSLSMTYQSAINGLLSKEHERRRLRS